MFTYVAHLRKNWNVNLVLFDFVVDKEMEIALMSLVEAYPEMCSREVAIDGLFCIHMYKKKVEINNK